MKLLTLIAGVFVAGSAVENRRVLNSVLREMFLNSTVGACPTCGQNKFAMESILSEGEIKKFRIEQIKKAILDNLGLNQAPTVEPQEWPQSFRSPSFINKFHQNTNSDNETPVEKLILVPQGITCDLENIIEVEELSIRMKYELPKSVDPLLVMSVKIWLDMGVTKGKVSIDKEPRSFFMELKPCGNETNQHITTFSGFQTFNGDWIEFDAMPVMRGWLDRGQKCFNISLTMKNWSHNYCKKIKKPEHKPFLSIHYKSDAEPPQTRLKRSRNCTRSSTECCRQNLYVSFEEIGWSKFIISPRGYEAYYCKGSCSTATSSTLSASVHNSVIQGLLAAGKDITSCCGPTEMSSMQLMVAYSNMTARLLTMANSVVDACGCM